MKNSIEELEDKVAEILQKEGKKQDRKNTNRRRTDPKSPSSEKQGQKEQTEEQIINKVIQENIPQTNDMHFRLKGHKCLQTRGEETHTHTRSQTCSARNGNKRYEGQQRRGAAVLNRSEKASQEGKI